MKQALLVVSFGTSVPQARPSISAVEQALADTAPSYAFLRAFTSPTIRRILSKGGEVVPSPQEALARLSEEGIERVVLQPTHLLYGYEYDKLKAEAEALAPHFRELVMGKPLLSDSGDIQRLASGLMDAYPCVEGQAVILMGHGTEHFANTVYPALQTALRLAGREDMLVGTVEGWPSFDDILAQLDRSTIRNTRLVPLMLVAGEHAREDMAGDGADSWKSQLERRGYAVTCSFQGLGLCPWVQEMYREHLLSVL